MASFSGMDVIFFLLAMATAYKIADGSSLIGQDETPSDATTTPPTQ